MSQTGTVGILGGGQLGRMLTEAALPLGFHVVVVDPGADCPAAQAGAKQIVGKLDDKEALKKLARQSDYITFEIEHFDVRQLGNVLSSAAAHHPLVNPSLATIGMIQDKYAQKLFLSSVAPIAAFKQVQDRETAAKHLEAWGESMIIKTRRGGFDGRGNMVVKGSEDIAKAFDVFKGQELYAEQLIHFKKELAVMVARDSKGNIVTYPVTETIHQRNICIETLAPAGVSPALAKQATKLATDVAKHLEGAGVFGIEMFLTDDGRILVNEIAPRVHNSGHYTIEACETSQFEQHIRAITGMPLGSTALKVPAAVMVNILGERNGPTELKGLQEAESIPDTAVHIYGKSPTKVDRKMGHITAIGDTVEEARKRAEQARKLIDV